MMINKIIYIDNRHLTFSDLNIKMCYYFTQFNITKNHHFNNNGYKMNYKKVLLKYIKNQD